MVFSNNAMYFNYLAELRSLLTPGRFLFLNNKCSSFFNLIFYLLETIKNIYKIDVTV